MIKQYTLVDICGTLFHSNTTFDFLDYFMQKKSYKYFRKLSRSILWKCFNRLFVYGGIDLTRIIAVRFLSGYTRKELLFYATDFYRNFLYTKINKDVITLVKSLNNTILISATLDFIAEVISMQLDIRLGMSTLLEYNDDSVCSGRIKEDLLGNKLSKITENGFYPPYLAVVTDDITDLDLVLNSEKSYIVINKKTKINRWENMLSSNEYLNYVTI